jgi:hypothetical protein
VPLTIKLCLTAAPFAILSASPAAAETAAAEETEAQQQICSSLNLLRFIRPHSFVKARLYLSLEDL